MSAGRPSSSFVYGLHDGEGNIFYVGKTTNFRKRMECYRGGRCHGNRALKQKLDLHGLHVAILAENPSDLHAAEFDQIEARPGLVNIVKDRHAIVSACKPDDPWYVPGCRPPSAQYMSAMASRFRLRCDWLKDELKSLSAQERLVVEWAFARMLVARNVPQAHKWVTGMLR